MTHHTDADRAEFKDWAEPEGYNVRDHPLAQGLQFACEATERAYSVWQAARRAPAVPVPQWWKLVPKEATPEMLEQVWYLGYDEMRDAYCVLVAAAPQPPDSEILVRSMAMLLRQLTSILRSKEPESLAVKRAMDFMTKHGLNGSPLRADVPENPSTGAACTGVGTLCTSVEPKSVPESAPVQMPEPVAWQSVSNGSPINCAAFRKPKPKDGKYLPLYTEQQVRQLLAAHGIKVAP